MARELGRGVFPQPLPLDGPSEIREVNESFNVMVSDLKRLASDREASARRRQPRPSYTDYPIKT